MKRNILLLTIFVVIVILFLLLKPSRKYNWNPTFAHDSDEPFGCKLFDEMAEATMPKGYSFSDDDPDELLSANGGTAVLIIKKFDDNYREEWDSHRLQQLEDFVRRGNKLMIVSDWFCVDFDETRDFTYDYDNPPDHNYLLKIFDNLGSRTNDYFTEVNLRKAINENEPGDTIVWLKPHTDTLRICKYLAGEYFTDIPEHALMLAMAYKTEVERGFGKYEDEITYYTRKDTIAFSLQIGKGTFYAHSNPLLFTNYGVTHHNISRYLNHAMTPLADCKVVRMPAELFIKSIELDYDDYSGKIPTTEEQKQNNPSPLSYLLSRSPLRWALYTILAAVLLFMLFTARRRQRVVPVMKQPENRNMEFVKLISSIYYHREDRHDLLKKKYTYFKDDLRRVLQMDIEDKSLLKANLQTLSRLTGLEAQDIEATLRDIRFYFDDSNLLEKQDMMKYIDFMNDILKKI